MVNDVSLCDVLDSEHILFPVHMFNSLEYNSAENLYGLQKVDKIDVTRMFSYVGNDHVYLLLGAMTELQPMFECNVSETKMLTQSFECSNKEAKRAEMRLPVTYEYRFQEVDGRERVTTNPTTYKTINQMHLHEHHPYIDLRTGEVVNTEVYAAEGLVKSPIKAVFVDIWNAEREPHLLRSIYEQHFGLDGPGYFVEDDCKKVNRVIMFEKATDMDKLPSKIVAIWYSFHNLYDMDSIYEDPLCEFKGDGLLTIQSQSYHVTVCNPITDCRKKVSSSLDEACLCNETRYMRQTGVRTVHQVFFDMLT